MCIQVFDIKPLTLKKEQQMPIRNDNQKDSGDNTGMVLDVDFGYFRQLPQVFDLKQKKLKTLK